MTSDDDVKDEAKLAIIGHLVIRDAQSGEVLLSRRAETPLKGEDSEDDGE